MFLPRGYLWGLWLKEAWTGGGKTKTVRWKIYTCMVVCQHFLHVAHFTRCVCVCTQLIHVHVHVGGEGGRGKVVEVTGWMKKDSLTEVSNYLAPASHSCIS